MSKNVAVFVDVANIFYAAKAAGVDIDYVTLLKSATAGRDFVRAYAYTGLDPENENQRQFHGFLARNGYRVVSKDIRKYGDGKVKANLDIELVVDLMKTSRNLDVAVIVSGDGDFAPAIRAVQEMGVRCEVISFRGNTSSDLIEVADVFTDITQIARVEKGSSRSGRRVAAEGDLSMTEVPDKETEGAPRRRGGRRRTGERETRETRERDAAREPAAAAATAGRPNLVVLPGEKLSRVAPDVEEPEAEELAELPEPLEGATPLEVAAAAGGADATDGSGDGAVGDGEDARRRRRRRGGRGRGRGRGGEREVAVAQPGAPQLEEDEDEAYEPPRLPQHSTFGSVWDSQLGVPSSPAAPLAGTPEGASDDEFDDEPEIPEYLLAERRQRGRGNRPGNQRGGRGGRGGAYQAAVQRERFGRGGGAGFGGAPRRDDRPFGRPQPQRQPSRGPAPEPAAPAASGGDGDPWSEVPPEVEAMLRAELARKGAGTSGGRQPEPTTNEPEAAAIAEPAIEDAAVEPEAATSPAAASASPEAEVPRRRTRRTRTASAGGDAPAEDTAAASGSTDVAPDATAAAAADGAAPKRRTRRKASPDTGTADAGGSGAGDVSTAEAAPEPEAPKRRTRRTRAAAGADDAGTAAPDVAAADAPAGDGGDAAPAAPKRRTRRVKATEDTGAEA